MNNKTFCPWGEDIWEEKIKKQNERGVIHGGRFSKSKDITDKITKETLKYLDKNVFKRIKQNSKIMDAGVGPLARFSIEFVKRGYSVVGVDISPTILNYAREHIKKQDIEGIKLIQEDLTKLNKLNEKFDFIFCFGTFGHIPKILALETLKNFYLRLKKRGLCFVHIWLEKDVLLKDKLKSMIYKLAHQLGMKMNKSFYVNCSFYSDEELKELFHHSGFKLIHKGKGGFFLLKK